MNDHIVSQIDGELRVSSETVAERTGSEHRAVLQLVRTHQLDFEEFGPLAFEMRVGNRGGSPVQIALLNEPQSTLLITYMRNSEIVKAFKLELVKQFYAMRQALTQPLLPQSYPEALRALAEQAEETAALAAKVTSDAPKVLFADAVSTTKTDILIGDLAKILHQNGLDIGAKRLFARLRDEGFLIRRPGTDWNMPTQRAMNLGLFRVKETAVTHSSGMVSTSITPKVTGKGQAYFVARFIKTPVVERHLEAVGS